MDNSTHSLVRSFAQQTTSFASGSVQHVTPTDFADPDSVGGCAPTHSRRPSTSSASSTSPKEQYNLHLPFDPCDVLDIRPMYEDDGADYEDPTRIYVRPTTTEPEPRLTPAGLPSSNMCGHIDGSHPPRCILMASVRALLKELREEQILQLKAGHGFAGFNVEELERWEELVG